MYFNMDIEKIRKERVLEGVLKYGPWTAEAFLASGRDPIQEGILELIDFLSYMEMANMAGIVSEGNKNWWFIEIKDLIRRVKLFSNK